MSPTYFILPLAILAEVIGTSALKSSDSFTKLLPSIITVIGYAVSLYLLSIALKSLPIGITYAVWAGLGIVAISLIGVFVYGQAFDLASVIGITFIVTGVVVINLFSNMRIH
ncbi:multidrug efflux SMR transporter [Francisellaceae bacterium]|nr:multidrug efflux SMR transporter [Francisellaceae bacterium]